MTSKTRAFQTAWLVAVCLGAMPHAAELPPRQLFHQTDNGIWLGADDGLFRYQPESELWTNVLNTRVLDLCIDEDVMWLGTSRGLQYANLKYLDWKNYGLQQGLTSDTVVRVVKDIDFVYAAGPHGLSRMDKLVEQWETIGDFSSVTIRDLYDDQDFLWVATDAGISYYEKSYEKWKQYTGANGLLSDNTLRLFYFTDYLWVLTDKGFSRYSSKMKTWNSYRFGTDIPCEAITTLWLDADYLWINTPQGIFRFSAKNQTWELFSKNTPLENLTVYDMATAGKTSWFTTADGVFSFQEETRRWITYTAIEGLSEDVQDRIYAIGQTIICKQANTFNVYIEAEDLWHARAVASSGPSDGKKQQTEFFNDERGLGFKTPSEQSVSLLGRAYFKLKNKAEFPDPIYKSIKNYILNNDLDSIVFDTLDNDSIVPLDTVARYKDFLYWWPKAQLNCNVDLKNGRTIRGSFDNTDPLGALHWGAEYRGYGDDILRKAGWLTDQKTDYFFSSLIDPTYLQGAAVRTEFGDRVGEKKRRRVNTGIWAGWRKTEYLKKVISFQEDNFYYLNVSNIITESVEITVDGTVVDPREFSIERTMGLLTFKNEGFVNPDSRIEITLEYEPKIGGHTNEMLAAENAVVFSDGVSVGANGVYRGIKEPDRPGTGLDTNRMVAGSINGKIDLKSANGKMALKAVPELSTSYNDSILVTKRGTAAKLTANGSFYNLKLSGDAQYYTPNYETLSDITSTFGRLKYQGRADATYDITAFMPINAGFSLLDAAAGEQKRQYLEYLFSPSGKPSLKLRSLHETSKSLTRSDPRQLNDSLQSERWNWHAESEWNMPEKLLNSLHLSRLWLNASYSVNFISDSLFKPDTLIDTAFTDTSVQINSAYLGHLNHNIFGWMQFAPLKNLSFETKQIIRLFQQRGENTDPWFDRGWRYRPEFSLFSQELLPGITLYGKFNLENAEDIADPDTTGVLSKMRLTSNILMVPGIWWGPLNILQITLGYNFAKEDSTRTFTDSNDIKRDNTLRQTFAQTYSAIPILNFSQDFRIANRSEFSNQTQFGHIRSEELKINNDIELLTRNRKTKFLIEYDLGNKTDYLRIDSTKVDTLTIIGLKHEPRFKWTERWAPNFRTELPINLMWQKVDSLFIDTSISGNYTSTISPGILFDWRIQRNVIREFRIQYTIGGSIYNGTFFEFDSYQKSWDNKLDVSLKAGRSFIFRMLLNLSYLFDEEMLRYDLAEVKATALF